jgi:hypothetical protein
MSYKRSKKIQNIKTSQSEALVYLIWNHSFSNLALQLEFKPKKRELLVFGYAVTQLFLVTQCWIILSNQCNHLLIIHLNQYRNPYKHS